MYELFSNLVFFFENNFVDIRISDITELFRNEVNAEANFIGDTENRSRKEAICQLHNWQQTGFVSLLRVKRLISGLLKSNGYWMPLNYTTLFVYGAVMAGAFP